MSLLLIAHGVGMGAGTGSITSFGTKVTVTIARRLSLNKGDVLRAVIQQDSGGQAYIIPSGATLSVRKLGFDPSDT